MREGRGAEAFADPSSDSKSASHNYKELLLFIRSIRSNPFNPLPKSLSLLATHRVIVKSLSRTAARAGHNDL